VAGRLDLTVGVSVHDGAIGLSLPKGRPLGPELTVEELGPGTLSQIGGLRAAEPTGCRDVDTVFALDDNQAVVIS